MTRTFRSAGGFPHPIAHKWQTPTLCSRGTASKESTGAPGEPPITCCNDCEMARSEPRRPMMRRYVKSFVVRIPAVRRYLEDKRSIAAALQASITERSHLVAEISYLRATGETLTAERNAARDEIEQIGATARFLGAARDAALNEVNRRQAELTSLVGELNEPARKRGRHLVNAAAERDRAIAEIRQAHDTITGKGFFVTGISASKRSSNWREAARCGGRRSCSLSGHA